MENVPGLIYTKNQRIKESKNQKIKKTKNKKNQKVKRVGDQEKKENKIKSGYLVKSETSTAILT